MGLLKLRPVALRWSASLLYDAAPNRMSNRNAETGSALPSNSPCTRGCARKKNGHEANTRPSHQNITFAQTQNQPMRTSLLVLTLPLILLLCFACGKVGDAEEKVISTSLEGGDTSIQTLQLEYLDLNLPERQYLVFRQELSLLDVNGFFGMETEALSIAATRGGIFATGPMTAFTYAWDTERGWSDVAVALPVEAGTELPPYVTITLPATKAIALDMKGPYDALSAMHVALSQELNRRGLKPLLPSIEEYLVGPQQTADENEFVTRIIYQYESPEK